jgi:glycosyltransferase involved in cell wall biosynthesis
MSRPKVSVLIPCFNAEIFIGETLESVFQQTWSEVEVIVVDDGSQDGSAAEIDKFRSAGVKLIRQQNMGAGAARNRAYQCSTGTFIQFLDADDIIQSNKIELQITRLIDHPRCVASAEWGRFYEHPRETKFIPELVWCDLEPLDWLALSRNDGLGMMFPALWLIPRTIVNAAGPWNAALSVGLGDDGEYFTRILLCADRVLFCPGAQCCYRSGIAGSLSKQKSRLAWTSEFRIVELCEEHVRAHEDSERIRRAFALSWQHFAHAAYPYDPALAEQAIARAQTLHPVRIMPGGGPRFQMLSRIIGWRAARRLQVASGRR